LVTNILYIGKGENENFAKVAKLFNKKARVAREEKIKKMDAKPYYRPRAPVGFQPRQTSGPGSPSCHKSFNSPLFTDYYI